MHNVAASMSQRDSKFSIVGHIIIVFSFFILIMVSSFPKAMYSQITSKLFFEFT